MAQGTIQNWSPWEEKGGGAERAGGQLALSQAFFSAGAPPSRARAHCCQSPEVSFFFLPKAVSCLSFELGCQIPHTVTLLQQPPRLPQQGRAPGDPTSWNYSAPPLLSALVWVLPGFPPPSLILHPLPSPLPRASLFHTRSEGPRVCLPLLFYFVPRCGAQRSRETLTSLGSPTHRRTEGLNLHTPLHGEVHGLRVCWRGSRGWTKKRASKMRKRADRVTPTHTPSLGPVL